MYFCLVDERATSSSCAAAHGSLIGAIGADLIALTADRAELLVYVLWLRGDDANERGSLYYMVRAAQQRTSGRKTKVDIGQAIPVP